MARKMASVKTDVKMGIDDSDETAAGIVADGCSMGVRSLHKYLNQYKGAEVPARALCRTLVAVEEQLDTELRRFL